MCFVFNSYWIHESFSPTGTRPGEFLIVMFRRVAGVVSCNGTGNVWSLVCDWKCAEHFSVQHSAHAVRTNSAPPGYSLTWHKRLSAESVAHLRQHFQGQWKKTILALKGNSKCHGSLFQSVCVMDNNQLRVIQLTVWPGFSPTNLLVHQSNSPALTARRRPRESKVTGKYLSPATCQWALSTCASMSSLCGSNFPRLSREQAE